MIVKSPPGSAKAVGKLQGLRPSARPIAEIGLPFRLYTCHATVPPFAQPIPSAQASRRFPRALPTTTGCLPFLSGETGSETFPVFGSSLIKNTRPCVSAAARISPAFSESDALLIGQEA